jgi:hypothetical protein
MITCCIFSKSRQGLWMFCGLGVSLWRLLGDAGWWRWWWPREPFLERLSWFFSPDSSKFKTFFMKLSLTMSVGTLDNVCLWERLTLSVGRQCLSMGMLANVCLWELLPMSVYGNACQCLSVGTFDNACLWESLTMFVCGNAWQCQSVGTFANICLWEHLTINVCGNAQQCLSVGMLNNVDVCGNAWLYAAIFCL